MRLYHDQSGKVLWVSSGPCEDSNYPTCQWCECTDPTCLDEFGRGFTLTVHPDGKITSEPPKPTPMEEALKELRETDDPKQQEYLAMKCLILSYGAKPIK